MSQFLFVALVLWFAWLDPSSCLDNGLVLTPPMGWMSWVRYGCETDCDLHPQECISEWLIRKTADLMVSEGYAEVGYKYIILDGCWMDMSRDEDNKLQPDPKRFPSGIKALADYVHSKGLMFGLYDFIGTKTTRGSPGSEGHFELDAQTFAEWGIDYVKLTGGDSETMNIDEGYPKFGSYLKKTGRPIVYSCNWPVNRQNRRIKWKSVIEHCNLWRIYNDVDDSWRSIKNTMDYVARTDFSQHAGPGHWNDPDMLIIGNFGLSEYQAEVQMAVWAILAAPLFMSTDLSNLKPEFKKILQNTQVIAINQDPLGLQGKRIKSNKGIEVWVRPISPKHKKYFSYAVAIVNRRMDESGPFSSSLNDLGLKNPSGYVVTDLFRSSHSGEILWRYMEPESQINVKVVPTGVVFLHFKVVSGEKEHNKGKALKDEVNFPSSTEVAKTDFGEEAPYQSKSALEEVDEANIPSSTEVGKTNFGEEAPYQSKSALEEVDEANIPPSTEVAKTNFGEEAPYQSKSALEEVDEVNFPSSTEVGKTNFGEEASYQSKSALEEKDNANFPSSTEVAKTNSGKEVPYQSRSASEEDDEVYSSSSIELAKTNAVEEATYQSKSASEGIDKVNFPSSIEMANMNAVEEAPYQSKSALEGIDEISSPSCFEVAKRRFQSDILFFLIFAILIFDILIYVIFIFVILIFVILMLITSLFAL